MPRNADLYDEYEDDEQDAAPTPKDLRAALKKANDEKAALAKQVEDLLKTTKANTLDGLLRDKKVPANIQRWMKRDEVDATSEAVDKWLEENGSDFGWKPEGDKTDEKPVEATTPQEVPAQQQGVLTEEDVANYIRLQSLGQAPSDVMPVDPVRSTVDHVAASINLDTPYEEVVRQLAAKGIPMEGDLKY